MSESSGGTSAVRPNQPARQVIARFGTYADAESAVDYLSDQRFAVEKVAIVGRDLELVEQVVGRLNYGWAALRGAAAGALTGALFGWIFGLLNWVQPLLTGLTLAFYGLIFGALIGALLGLLMYALQGGRRDFTSIQSLQPRHYEVLADVEVADEAVRLLTGRTDRKE
ncbi:glycine zipper family protein [Rhodococcus sp. T2V]|uniref:general stress protein n=1 Tax=Rhodococcus sp. T2V TaxID=3034164 RepID=UPI0023E19EF9|nr:general stress protein [Rhodococcus sp. T2V]MDF3312059.1 glycine zipper family protein [Rhodococcus sp. T2V]